MDQFLPNFNHGYAQVGFSDRLQRLLAAKANRYVSRTATRDELLDFSERVRLEIPQLAADDTLIALREKNATIFQVVTEVGGEKIIGFNAQLPLTEEGRDAVISGSFNPGQPELDYVAAEGKRVSAFYAWLIYSPRSFVAVTAALASYVDRHSTGGCSIFCRAANDKSHRIFISSGYEPARLTYAEAPEDLLVAHPRWVATETPTPAIEVVVARSMLDLTKIIAIRAATYMSEQECPFDEEFDGNDLCAAHMIGMIDGEPAGCIRIRFFGSFVKFERLAVRKEFRNSKLAFRLVRAAMRYAADKGFDRVYGHARRDLVRFWETFGFRRIAGRPDFTFSDIAYCEMEGTLSATSAAIAIGDPPLRMIRPEGAWHEPGPLERAPDPSRFDRVSNGLKRGK